MTTSRPQRPPTAKRRGGLSSVQIMFAAILSIGLILAINFSSRISDSRPLQEAYDRVSADLDRLRVERERLTALRDYVLSDGYVENWARDNGKMIRPGEILVVPVPSGAIEEAIIAPQVVIDQIRTLPEPVEPWELWWQVFFDSPAPDLSAIAITPR